MQPQRVVLLTIAGLLFLSVSACAVPRTTFPAPVTVTSPTTRPANETIWALDSGWHTGLILARDELGARLTARLDPRSDIRYLMFGWGNRKFYMAPAPTLGMDLAALFPSHSTVLVEGCGRTPRRCYTSAIKIHAVQITAAGQHALDAFLLDSFRTKAGAGLEPLGPGPDPGSEFYASGLTYDAFHTCNTWTAEALRAAGVPLSDPEVIFASQLWRQLGHPVHEDGNQDSVSGPGQTNLRVTNGMLSESRQAATKRGHFGLRIILYLSDFAFPK